MSITHYQASTKRFIQYLLTGFVVFSLFITFMIPELVSAATFGSGDYGTCPYDTDCPSTVVTLPPLASSTEPPLEVNINLTNGQVIPRSWYTILVTPLNGQGSSFEDVEFYINGTLVHSQVPDEEGTVRWFWNVSQFPGTVVKIVVNGQNGQSVTRSFQVKISSISQHSASTAIIPAIIRHIVSSPTKVVHALSHTLAKLPRQIKYGLPYFLFILLGADVILLFYRTRHEIAESKLLNELLIREREFGELKYTFTELISHYLRTPITIITGAIDLAAAEQKTAATTLDTIRSSIHNVTAAINQLLNQLANSNRNGSDRNQLQGKQSRAMLWRQPGLYAPIGLIGLVAFCFDYLARHSKGFSIGQINVIIQIVVFGSLSVSMYQIIRHLQLKRRDKEETSRVLAAETDFNTNRDQMIDYSANQLKHMVDGISSQLVQLESPAAKRIAENGMKQLENVVTKLQIANRLQGSQSSGPYSTVQLKDLVNEALVSLEPKLVEKMVHVNTTRDMTIYVQSQDLLIIVLWTILDNALSYSEKGGEIEVDASLSGNSAIISVTDHGAGIAADKKFSLFQAFSKTEGAETFNHEGMGFSLYLDKLIMNYLVGDISVQSESGQGTKVLLSLPQPLPG